MDFMSSIISSAVMIRQNGEEDDDDENNVSHNNYLFSNVASFMKECLILMVQMNQIMMKHLICY